MFEIRNLENRPLIYDLEGEGKDSFRLLVNQSKKIKENEITEKMRKDEKDGLIMIRQKDLPKATILDEGQEEEKD
jgi:hypothetical protein